MNFRLHRLLVTAGLALGIVGVCSAASPLKVNVQPVFEGHGAMNGVLPLRIELRNDGGDARGVVHVTTNGWSSDYPVELPRGSEKALIAYPVEGFEPVNVDLDTDRGRVHEEFSTSMGTSYGDSMVRALLVTNEPGQLRFIAQLQPGQKETNGEQSSNLTISDSYGRPGQLPTRSVGYQGFSVIILGSTSERMTDEEVQALKTWVMEGGTLMFVGGASAPILGDPRWADLLPERNLHVAELRNSEVLAQLGGIPLNEREGIGGSGFPDVAAPAATVTTGELAPGATGRIEKSVYVTAEKRYGLGRTVILGFNVFESPLNKWDGRHEAMSKLIRGQNSLAAQEFLRFFYASQNNSYPAYGSSGSMGRPLFNNSIENDPFSMKLPPTMQIFGVLIGYFLVVVPLNFLVLRKLRRGELAWITAPIISLAFAGVLFTAARGLYGAKMSTVSHGVIVGQEGNPEAMFIGSTKLFVPMAGVYDLELTGVDSLGSLMDGSEMMYQPSASGAVHQVDDGQVTVPELQATNLSFQEFEYRQRLPISTWFHVKLTPLGSNEARCEVQNTGSYVLSGANLVFGSKQQSLGELEPGQRQSVNVHFRTGEVLDVGINDVRRFTVNLRRVALTGTIDGFRPGPQVGTVVPGKSHVQLVLFSGWDGGVN